MPPSNIVVRGQEPEDIPDLTEVWNQPRAIWGTLQLPFMSVDARRARNAAAQRGVTRLVAVVDSKVVGSLGLHRLENRRAHVGEIGMGCTTPTPAAGSGRR